MLLLLRLPQLDQLLSLLLTERLPFHIVGGDTLGVGWGGGGASNTAIGTHIHLPCTINTYKRNKLFDSRVRTLLTRVLGDTHVVTVYMVTFV